jgi:hypothetical protein
MKAIPACAGLPAEFVRRKVSNVLPPIGMEGDAKLLVNMGWIASGPPTIAETVFVVDDCGRAPTSCVLVAVLAMTVPAGGI